jgi:hypothetical protein
VVEVSTPRRNKMLRLLPHHGVPRGGVTQPVVSSLLLISLRRDALLRGRRQIWMLGLPAEGVAATVASSGSDFVLRLRRRGGACSGAAVEMGSLYRSWSGLASPAVDRETVQSARVVGVGGRQTWLHPSTASMGCSGSGARRQTWGTAPTDVPQRQRCRLRRPTFEVHKATAAMETRRARGVWFPSSLLPVAAAAASEWGGGWRFRCRDLQGVHCNFLFFEVLFAFVWVHVVFCSG